MVYEPWMPLFAPRTSKWLRYSTTALLSSASGVVTTHVFRANDLFDPDFTGTGHQPMGFDQMMVFYNHFCVTDARIRVVFRSSGTSLTACIRVDADSTPITVIDRIVEFGGCVTSALEFKSGYGANKELALTVSIPKLQGVPLQAILADVNLRGTAVSSPSEISYFHVQIWDTAAATGASQIDVILEQKATFTEPRDISQSLRAPSQPVGCQERKQGGQYFGQSNSPPQTSGQFRR